MPHTKKEISPVIETLRADLKNKSIEYATAVEKLLSECHISNTPHPIPIVQIAEKLGFKVYNVTFRDENIAGIMCDTRIPAKPFDEKRVIALNRNDYATRKRFTIAHELGHFLLHCGDTNDFYERYKKGLDRGQRDIEENEANHFAAELLMPKSAVQQVVQENRCRDIDDMVCAIEKTFIVSPKAARRRLEELEIIKLNISCT